jgi:hypothetical protein
MPMLEKHRTTFPLPTFSLISPVPISFAKLSLIEASPCLNMEPSPKKPKKDPRNLTEEDGEAIRKVMAGLEKHLKSKNQSQAAVDFELKKVKEVVRHDPTLRIFVKRIVISVSLELIKVILILFNFSFFLSKFVIFRTSSPCSPSNINFIKF